MSKFNKIIKKLRTEKEISQEDLGKILNLSKSTISLYESNKREPDFKTLEMFADFFNVTTDYLLGRTDDSIPIKKIKKQPEFSPIDKKLINAYIKMDDKNKEKIIELITYFYNEVIMEKTEQEINIEKEAEIEASRYKEQIILEKRRELEVSSVKESDVS